MKLATYLADHKITAAELAARAGMPASTITRILAGERQPRLDTIVRIQRATEGAVGVADFMPMGGVAA